MKIHAALLVCLLLAQQLPAQAAEPAKVTPAVSECRWLAGKIEIDGRADDAAWKDAPVLDRFVTGWARPAAAAGRTPTKARLLWNNDGIYFLCEMVDADLYADVKDQDGATWTNDVFELFFKPSVEKRAYYEFEVSANNTVLDMLLPSRGSGGYARWGQAQKFHLKTAVTLDGTLNKWEDKDRGWTAEGLIPWEDFARTGGKPSAGDRWKFTLCRYDYSVEYEQQELTATAPLTRPDFHHYEDYTDLLFVGAK